MFCPRPKKRARSGRQPLLCAADHFRHAEQCGHEIPENQNEDGKEVELTHGNYIQFLESPNREVRERAFKAVYETYGKQKNTIAATLNANVNKNIFYSRVRKYPSVLEMALYGDNIPKEVYTNLIDTIHESLPLLHRYMELRKKLLGVDELHMYDLFAPLVEEYKWDITYEEAKQMTKEGLTPLGEDYLSDLQAGYDNGWIDVYENENKRTGAYSWGAYGTHPYVPLNHKDNLNSMFTLAHEMGHALHSYYSDNALKYRDAQYTIFLAEVASTTNEALLMDYLLKTPRIRSRKCTCSPTMPINSGPRYSVKRCLPSSRRLCTNARRAANP